jgi:hypothetical protein
MCGNSRLRAHLSLLPLLANTEIIANSVIILFICDLDELLYGIIVAVSPRWVKSMTNRAGGDSDSDSAEPLRIGDDTKFECEMATLKKELRLLSHNMTLILKHSPELTGMLAAKTIDKDEDEFKRFLAIAGTII